MESILVELKKKIKSTGKPDIISIVVREMSQLKYYMNEYTIENKSDGGLIIGDGPYITAVGYEVEPKKRKMIDMKERHHFLRVETISDWLYPCHRKTWRKL